MVVNIDALADPVIEVLGVVAVAAGPAGRRVPRADRTADAAVRHAHDRPAAGAGVAAAAVRPAGRHRRPGAQAVERLHAHPVGLRRRPTASSTSSTAARGSRPNSDGPAALDGAIAAARHRVPRRLLLLRPRQPDPDQHPPARPRRRDGRPGRARTAAARRRWSACCRASTTPTTAASSSTASTCAR